MFRIVSMSQQKTFYNQLFLFASDNIYPALMLYFPIFLLSYFCLERLFSSISKKNYESTFCGCCIALISYLTPFAIIEPYPGLHESWLCAIFKFRYFLFSSYYCKVNFTVTIALLLSLRSSRSVTYSLSTVFLGMMLKRDYGFIL